MRAEGQFTYSDLPQENQPVVLDSADLSDAIILLEEHGEHAVVEAAIRAMDSRDRGNVVLFCRWRQVARFLSSIADAGDDVTFH